MTLYLDEKAESVSEYSLPIDAVGILWEASAFWFHLLTDLEFYIAPFTGTECPF